MNNMTSGYYDKSNPRFTLDGLFVFSQAVKHMNFTRAAGGMGITQAAVSRRIKHLEQQLGCVLFVRKSNRKLELTRDGEKLYQAVETSFSLLNSVVQEIKRPEDKNTITVTTTQGFATLWLLKRLTFFNETYTDLNIRLVLDDNCLDLDSEGIDLGIRYGDGQWDNVDSQLLFSELVYPVCTPEYLKRYPEISSVQNLTEKHLLHVEERTLTVANWHKWFQSFGTSYDSNIRKLSYNNYPLLIQSCLNNLGVVLGWHHMIYDLLQNKELVRPVCEVLQTEIGFYIVKPQGKPLGKSTETLQNWILGIGSNQQNPETPGSKL